MPGSNVAALYQTITQYNLDAQDRRLAQVKELIEHGLISESMARDYLLLIEPAIRHARDFPNPLHRPPTAEELYADGPPDIEFGSLVAAPEVRVGLRLSDRVRSVLISGNSGSGKSTLVNNLATGAYARGYCLVIIQRKGDLSHLPQEMGNNWVHLNVHDSRTRLGLNPPAGVPSIVWINHLSTCLCARAGMVAAWTPLASILRWLVVALNPTPGTLLNWPSLESVLQVARSTPPTLWGGKPGYVQTLINTLEPATHATNVFECFGGLDIDRDIVRTGKHLLLEIPNFSPAWLRQFTKDLLESQLIVGRIHRQEKMCRRVLIVEDEADQDVTMESDRQFPDGMMPASVSVRMGRALNIMRIACVAKLAGTSDYLRADSIYHAFFNQSDAESIVQACKTLLLPRGSEQLLPALRPGQCIFREAQGPWPHPMLVQVDYLPAFCGPITRPYDSIPFIPAQKLDDLPHVKQALRQLIEQHNKATFHQNKEKGKSQQGMSSNAHALLHAAALHPWFPVARLWEKAQLMLPPQTQIDVRAELKTRDLAEWQEVRIGKTNVLLVSVTDEGWRFLGRTPPTRDKGRGSIAHRHVARWIADCGSKRGHKALTEWIVPGTSHPVDVAWHTTDGMIHVFEVVIDCESNLSSHIRACLTDPSPVTDLTIVVTQKGIRDRLAAEIGADVALHESLPRIRFETVDTYLKELWP